MTFAITSIAQQPYVALCTTPSGRQVRADVRAATERDAIALIRREAPALRVVSIAAKRGAL